MNHLKNQDEGYHEVQIKKQDQLGVKKNDTWQPQPRFKKKVLRKMIFDSRSRGLKKMLRKMLEPALLGEACLQRVQIFRAEGCAAAKY